MIRGGEGVGGEGCQSTKNFKRCHDFLFENPEKSQIIQLGTANKKKPKPCEQLNSHVLSLTSLNASTRNLNLNLLSYCQKVTRTIRVKGQSYRWDLAVTEKGKQLHCKISTLKEEDFFFSPAWLWENVENVGNADLIPTGSSIRSRNLIGWVFFFERPTLSKYFLQALFQLNTWNNFNSSWGKTSQGSGKFFLGVSWFGLEER